MSYNYQNYYPQAKPVAPAPNMYGLRGRPVASLEEVRASSIDFDGSVFFFPDLANKRIYTKQINMDGTAVLNMYELKEMPISQPNFPTGDYITRKEFEEAMIALRASLQPQPQVQSNEVMNF